MSFAKYGERNEYIAISDVKLDHTLKSRRVELTANACELVVSDGPNDLRRGIHRLSVKVVNSVRLVRWVKPILQLFVLGSYSSWALVCVALQRLDATQG